METITDRFFAAYGDLLTAGRTSQRKFCKELGVDRRNFDKQAADHSRHILRPEWLAILVTEYAVSSDWLLTGKGWPWGE